MSNLIVTDESPEAVRLVVKVYAYLLLAGFAFVPAYLIAYLYLFQDPTLLFENHLFHIIAITAATLEGLFVTYVTWRCYQSSGDPLLRWMTLGFLGFVIIYALHGAFTGQAHTNIWLFLLYGPASRLVMSILLLVGMLSYHRPPDTEEQRTKARPWLTWIGLFLLVNVAVAYVANSPIAGNPLVRLSMEGGALVLSALTVAILLLRRIRSPLMMIFVVSVSAFALSSLAFILARPWNHMWWLAHAIFAGGFFMLSYGVVQAFLTTRSFSKIYSQEELMVRLAEAMAYTESALQELQRTNQELGHLAATDPLTGADNRRRFMERVEVEIGRTKRGIAPFSVLALDLDNFKSINDRFGHQVGDDILKSFVEKCLDSIRPYDGVARVGGEEFMILLPQTSLEGAHVIAERLRSSVANSSFHGLQRSTVVTVSIGVSQSGRDGDTIEAILRAADQRLYHAKHEGRNRVVTTFKTSLQPLP
ncbi:MULTISPECIES: diguanylate cyclase [Pseudomonas]|uniref:diguanylate cyclase n=1 Tax=Pseudomonas izuensis TaxID=2684212 RepID=A0ABM7RTY5_9PSED|nr:MULTISPECIES: diguanylate cyclase [Pseudomonas]RKS24898.1 diguanylate cyclase (GGDEF)-like protein [Pseudomonas sp. WPR_5_2]BCX69015.1 diguanylate cyclase [Pseudomonas izuensis]